MGFHSRMVSSRSLVTRQRASRFISRLTLLEKHKTPRHNKRRLGLLCRVAEELLSPAELKQVADSVQKELQRLGHLGGSRPARGQLMQAIEDQLVPIGFPQRPEDQDQLVHDVLEDSFRQRQALIADALSAPQVARLLQTSRQTPLNRAEKGTLLALYQNGKWLFPRWQFDTKGTDGVITGLPQVLQVLQVSPVEKLSWFVRRSPYLEDRTPLEVLRSGDLARVVSLARGVGGQ
jgi:hypothetical protein